MAINITDGFNLNYAAPVDYRMVVADSTARIALTYKYDGLKVFQSDNRNTYIYNLSSTSWEIENSDKITASGSTNYIPKFTGTNSTTGAWILGNSPISAIGGNVGISTNNPTGAYTYLQIGGTSLTEDPYWYSGQSLPLIIHKGGVAVIGYNWYWSGVADAYFDSAVGSSTISFFDSAIGFRTRPGSGSFVYSMFVYPGYVVFSDALTSGSTKSPMIRSQGSTSHSTQTTPDFTWYNNDQTGIFRPSANVIAFTNDGSESARITADGSVIIGTSTVTPTPIHTLTLSELLLGYSSMFPSVTPKLNILVGNSISNYEELMVLRGLKGSVSNTLTRLGIIMKLSDEYDANESSKMGGMILESTQGYSNSPSLYLTTANSKRLGIDYYGNVLIGTTTPFSLGTGQDSLFTLNGTASVTAVYHGTGTNNWPSISFKNDQSTGIYWASPYTIGFSTAGSQRMTISNNVGIGLSSPTYKLTVNGVIQGKSITSKVVSGTTLNVGGSFYNGDVHLLFGQVNGSNNSFIQSTSGDVTYSGSNIGTASYTLMLNPGGGVVQYLTGNLVAISDSREKRDINYTFNYGLDEVNLLKPATFKYLNSDESVMGFVAQDIMDIIPDLISKYKISEDEDRLSLKETSIMPILVKAIQELSDRVKYLESNN